MAFMYSGIDPLYGGASLTIRDSSEAADAVFVSPFYLQKGFKLMTGYSMTEYIRSRRLYLAALDVLADKGSITDLAFKYGYDTPESFSKAFRAFMAVRRQS